MTDTKTLTSVNKALQAKFKGKKLVFGQGAIGATVVVVSEMLDVHGEKDKKPVGGVHAKMLNQLLKQAGINPSKVYVTNVVKYRPDPEHMPTPKEIKSHATFLKEEIRTVNPQVVVTLGNLALNGVGLRIPVENVHGRTFPLGGYRLMPTFHPESVIKNPEYRVLLDQDFAKLKALMREPQPESNS